MVQDQLGLSVKGHVRIEDDQGVVLLDRDNAVHPQNMARVIARALSNEHNFFINRIAFGNGGTVVDAVGTVTFRPPNDGQGADSAAGWRSRLYNETYSEIINEGSVTLNPLLGTDPGSFSSTGQRPGGGSNAIGDPASIPHISGPGVRSNELGVVSEVVITCVLNPGEPKGQLLTDQGTTNPTDPLRNTEASFVFDELGLFTGGAPLVPTSGFQAVDVGTRTSADVSGLLGSTQYQFTIAVNANPTVTVSFTTPATGTGPNGEITYGDLCEALNTGNTAWNSSWAGVSPLPSVNGAPAKVTITDYTKLYPSITGSQTYGYLRFTSPTAGATSSITLGGTMFASLNPPTGGSLMTAVPGSAAGVQNLPTAPDQEGERLLTHLVFWPINKTANRSLTITYVLTVYVARSTH